ncbi:MAG: PIN domain-containing protein [bacterium]|nr:PIN domain-containing protein [bacterium]
MSVECFLDTNILVYAVSSVEHETAKKARALELIETSDFGLSMQVMQEFYVTVTRRIAKPLTPEIAVEFLEELRKLPHVVTDYPLIIAGIESSLRFGISYWDGAILAAAARLHAPIIFSEDLSDGQAYGSVRVVNPFRELGPNGVHDVETRPYG